ncbi:GspH/FimT family protein [Saccharophagus degradans]|uniref:Type II secretion system protein H n=1 Tax=Saccharophagus degradans TaxID=86304 RepID=A0AAW7XD53_9GAMM|nr:GspH/FimT family protein [Saccharophagus degradans]MDO6424688.1 GspH/FimT family protein [Saccharophagus degradans]MDO6609021.1 GspH/FimT family protein [Saccharophagus degradans]
MMQHCKSRGFTLLDLLIALAILSLLINLATPNLTSSLEKSKSKSLTVNIRSAIALARTKAITTEQTVSICGLQNNNECTKNQFTQIAIFVDKNKNGRIDEAENVLLLNDLQYTGQITLGASLGRKYIRFKKDGSAQQAGSFTYCNPNHPTYSSRVTISMMGRLYTAKDLDNDGIVENSDGSPISC